MSLEILHTFGAWLALCVYTVITGLFISTWASKASGLAAVAAALLTTLHLLARVLLGLSFITIAFETLSLLAWISFLAMLLGVRHGRAQSRALRTARITLGAAAFLSLCDILVTWHLTLHADQEPDAWSTQHILRVLIGVAGLLFVEQLYRNAKSEDRWRVRYLGIGLGTLFLFQILVNATSLHGAHDNLTLLALEPAIMALIAPCLIVAIIRNRLAPMELSLSRRLVFGVGTLFASGLVLLALGAFGYLITAFEGDWRFAFVTLVVVTIAIASAIVFGSSGMRARTRKLLAENLFRQKYDYRSEWLRVTGQLTQPSPDYNLPQQVIRALGQILMAEGGAVWLTTEGGSLAPIGQLNVEWEIPISQHAAVDLDNAFEENEHLLDLRRPNNRVGTIVLDELRAFPDLRYVVPLLTESRLVGIVGLRNPPAAISPGWEDHDILRLIAREAAGIVALQAAERALSEADRLHGYHQLSAFVLHDVKTIAAQLSLLLQNAERHRNNPVFVDDMLKTVANSVLRVNRLLEQLDHNQAIERNRIDLRDVLEQALQPLRQRHPAPALQTLTGPLLVSADPHRLASAISHLVQNAIDASVERTDIPNDERRVLVTLAHEGPWATVHIEDNGAGMDREFIESRLFQPLTSTKGVAGMGIGAYQARTYVRSLGGDIAVTSDPGDGTHFILRLPLESSHG